MSYRDCDSKNVQVNVSYLGQMGINPLCESSFLNQLLFIWKRTKTVKYINRVYFSQIVLETLKVNHSAHHLHELGLH